MGETGSSLRVRPGAQPPGGQADGQRVHAGDVARSRLAVTDVHLLGPGQGSVGVAALRGHERPPGRHRLAAGQDRGRVGVAEPDESQHLPGERHGQLDHVGGTAAAQDVDRLGHLDGVAAGPPEGGVHPRQHGGRRHAGGGAEPHHGLGQGRRAEATSFMNAPEPTFTSSTNAEVPSAIFFDMIELAIRGIDSTVPVTSRKA